MSRFRTLATALVAVAAMTMCAMPVFANRVTETGTVTAVIMVTRVIAVVVRKAIQVQKTISNLNNVKIMASRIMLIAILALMWQDSMRSDTV